MDEILECPMCRSRMRTHHWQNKYLFSIGKKADYMERICSCGHNHLLTVWIDKSTRQIDFMRISLNPKYSKFLEIDFVNQKSRILCINDGVREYINLPRVLDLDFPDLVGLKEKINLLVLFS